MSELRVKLTGPAAALGSVPATDVARLLLLIERATAKAASVVLRQPKVTTGRYRDVIAQASRFRLQAIEAGSVVPVLCLPELETAPEDSFELDVATLGETAVDLLLDAVEGGAEPHPVVAKALLDLADGMRVGDRYEAVAFEARMRSRARRDACVDGTVRARLREYVARGPEAPSRFDAIAGTLVEVDFERRTARLHVPTQPSVQVDFPEDLADDVHAALRHATTLRGEVAFDPTTNVAKAVAVTAIDPGTQLVLGAGPEAFWSELSFEELAREQGAGGPVDPDALYDDEATDAERDAFIAALAESR